MWFRDRPVVVGVALAAVVALAVALIVLAFRDKVEKPEPALPMSSYAPKAVTGQADIAYGTQPMQKLDAFFPKKTAAGQALPTIVWTHGGGWSAGDKADVDPYLQILADRGFTTIGINYSLSPVAKYPTQVQELNAALSYVMAHAEELHVDTTRLVLAGDSGGAQITAQVAALTTDPSFAAKLGIGPAVKPDQVSAVLLASGAFDLAEAVGLDPTSAKYVGDYLGSTTNKDLLEQASVTPNVTEKFPPTWMTTGNADPLMPQAKAFADKLKAVGVEVDTVFYGKAHLPALIHEYQFALDLEDSRLAFEDAVKFLKRKTG